MTELTTSSDQPGPEPAKRWGWGQRLLVVLSLSIVVLAILATPAGLLNKADWVGYAICHRIPSHSLLVNERPLPLCARCTGTYLGAMLALTVFLFTRPRASSFPPLPVLLTLFGFTVAWALDGSNSYIDLSNEMASLLRIRPVYPPQNWLRLLTGTLHGLMMASLFYPIAAGTFWRNSHPVRVLRNFKELGGLVLLALIAVALVLTGSPVILYPLSLVSSAGVLTMLTLVNTVMLLVLIRRENRAESWRDLILPLLAGLALSLILVNSISIVRYALTGTMTSLPGLSQ